MKKFMFGMLAAAILVLTLGAVTSTGLWTYQCPYLLVRGVVGADETQPTLTSAGDFANKGEYAVDITPADTLGYQSGGGIQIMACCAADNGTFDVTLYGWRSTNGPATKLLKIAFTGGSQKVVKYPHNGTAVTAYWADTAVVTDYALTGTAFNSAGNNVAVVKADLEGYKWIRAVVDNMLSGANDVCVYRAMW